MAGQAPDDTLGEAAAEQLAVQGQLPQHREGQAVNVGTQAADVLRQGLGQHVDAPLHQVDAGAPARSAHTPAVTACERRRIPERAEVMRCNSSSLLCKCCSRLARAAHYLCKPAAAFTEQ